MDGLPFVVIVILGIVQGVLLSLILWINKKGNQTANRLLSLLIVLMVWHHLQNISIFLNFYPTFPHFFGADHGSLFLFGPLFYFYTLKVAHPSFSFKRLHLFHFLPFVLVTLYDPVLFLGTDAKVEAINLWLTTMRYDKPELASRFFISNVLFFMQFVHVMFYMAWSTKRRHALQQTQSALHQIHLQWLRKLTVGFGLVLLISFLFQRLLYIVIHYYSYSFDYVYIVPMTLFIYAIGFVAMRQPEVYYGAVDGRPSKKKYESSSLSQKDAENYAKALLHYMNTETPYLEPTLKLADIADTLAMHPNHLSQVINEQLNQPFLTFINTYRIEAAKHILEDPDSDQKTMLQIAYEVGFNNKVSFNTHFKKMTGKTPTAYRKARTTV